MNGPLFLGGGGEFLAPDIEEEDQPSSYGLLADAYTATHRSAWPLFYDFALEQVTVYTNNKC